MLRSDSRVRRMLVLMGMVLAVGALVAGCGGSDSSSSSESSTPAETSEAETGANTTADETEAEGGSGGGVEEAKELTAKYEEVPKSIGITEPIGKPIPEGKEVMFMLCGNPSCDAQKEPLEAAAKVLGWKLTTAVAGPTPDKTREAWDLAVREKPDAVISSGFPKTLWSKQLSELEAEGIPVAECCTLDEPGEGIIFVETGEKEGKFGGKLQADWTVANSDGEANTLYIDIPAFPILAKEREGFEEEYKRLCPECGFEVFNQNVADLGQSSGLTKIVGYLRSHPDINYIAAGADDSFVGLPAALNSVGLGEKVKGIGLAPSTVNLNYIVNEETEAATIGFPIYEIGWKNMDILARYFTESSLKPDEEMLPRKILTANNIKDPNTLEPITPSYEEEFKKLWGK